MTDTTELFLITGATGKTGAPTVGLLRERGFRVRAFVHTLDDRATRLRELGAEVVQGNLLNFDAVSSALVGVSAAYFCYPIDPPRLLEATAIFAQAATDANVGAVVNMSQSPARREAQYYGPREHWIAERLLDRTPMMTTHCVRRCSPTGSVGNGCATTARACCACRLETPGTPRLPAQTKPE